LTVNSLRLSVAAILVTLVVSGCVAKPLEPGIDPNGPAIATVTLTPANASVTSGGTLQFSVTLSPVPSDVRVIWSVTDTVTASIDQNGKLTAKSPGKTTVSARSVLNVNTKGSAPVTVTQP
jgi:uncharacterized protein YjdB